MKQETRILVLSDTHGAKAPLRSLVLREQPDKIFHLGDNTGDALYLADLGLAPVEGVRGNCDYGSDFAGSRLVRVGGHLIMLTHGHLFGVKTGLHRLYYSAQEAGAEAVLFGHTHVPHMEWEGGLLLFNPGSLGEPRLGPSSYGILTVSAAGIQPRLKTLAEE